MYFHLQNEGQPAAPPAAGQDPTQAAAELQAPVIVAIAPTDIQSEGETATQALTRIDQLAAVDAEVATITAEIASASEEIDAEFVRLQAIDRNTAVLRTIEDLETVWLGFQREVAAPGRGRGPAHR